MNEMEKWLLQPHILRRAFKTKALMYNNFMCADRNIYSPDKSKQWRIKATNFWGAQHFENGKNTKQI